MERVLAIHRALEGGRRCTATELARDLDVHVRTIYRDVEFLRDHLGAPLVAQGNRGYRYSDTGYSLPDVTLTEGELLAFLVAERVVEGYAGSGAPFVARIRQGLQKLSQGLGRRVTVALDDLARRRFAFDPRPLQSVKPDVLQELHRALAGKSVVAIRYQSPSGDGVITREIEPYHLANHAGDWRIVAWCRLSRDVRTFALSRVLECELREEAYSIPPDFDPRPYLRDEVEPVRIRFSPHASSRVAERTWHPSQRLEPEEDGSVVLTLEVPSSAEVVRWILAHGREARVLHPPELVERVRREVGEMASQYGGAA